MSRELRQSTAQTERIGPFLDATNGVDEETGLTTPATRISKDGAAYEAGTAAGAHDEDGWYPVTFSTGDTDTLGSLVIKSQDPAVHLPVWHEFMVLTANEYDSKYGTDKLEVDVVQWLDTAVPAPGTAGVPSVDAIRVDGILGAGDEVADKVWDENIGDHMIASSIGLGMNALFVSGGTVEASGSNSTTQVQTTLIEATEDHYIGGHIVFVGDLEGGQSRLITAYQALGSVIKWEPALTGIPAVGDAFVLLGTGHTVNLRTATQTTIDAIGLKQNQAFSDLEFLMVLASDGQTPAIGLTVTGERSIDGGAYVSVSGTIAEVSDGTYQFDALAADMNGAAITFKFSSATARDSFIFITTTP